MYRHEKAARLRSVLSTSALLFLAAAEPVMSQGAANQTSQAEEPKSTDSTRKKSAAEIAAELANPNTTLGSLNFNLDYVRYSGSLPGAVNKNAFRLTFQPSLPVPLGEGLNFFARPAVPIVFNQDVPVTGSGFDGVGVDLGDIGFDVGVGKTFLPIGVVLVGGMVGTLPTATSSALSKDQWALGPEGLIGWVQQWGVLGLLLTHQWDVAGGADDVHTSVTGGQYFYVFNLKDGWQIRSGPTFSYDHEASEGQHWTFPIGIGISKTAIAAGTPLKLGCEYWYYLAQPEAYGPDWQIRFSFGPVVPLPW